LKLNKKKSEQFAAQLTSKLGQNKEIPDTGNKDKTGEVLLY
jgi:hypothetical protein